MPNQELLMDPATLKSLNKIYTKLKNKKMINERLWECYNVVNYRDLDKDDALEFLSSLDRNLYLETLEQIEKDNQILEEILIKEEIDRLIQKYPERFVLIEKTQGYFVISSTAKMILFYRNENGLFTIHEKKEEKILPITVILEYGDYKESSLVKNGKAANWPVLNIKSFKTILHKLEKVTLPKD